MAGDLSVAFLLAAGALVLTPGPDTVYVLDRGLNATGRVAGLAAACGVTTGILVHTTGVILGLSALVRASPTAYQALQYVGGVYLFLLGGNTLWRVATGAPNVPLGSGVGDRNGGGDGNGGDRASGIALTARDGGASQDGGVGRAYLQGIAVNVLNPKVAVFFLAFLPQFAGPTTADLAIHGGGYAGLTLAYLGLVAASTHRVRAALTERPWVADALRGLSGVVLVGFGVELALAGVPL
ncbi:MAG: LysE family translocator [Haloglomus sp.]